MLHSKQSDNSNRDNVSYCNPVLPATKVININSGKLSETYIPLSNCNRYDVATCKAKAPHLSDAEQKDLIKNVFATVENGLNDLKNFHGYVIPLVKMLLTV